jgi:hypothetical protein
MSALSWHSSTMTVTVTPPTTAMRAPNGAPPENIQVLTPDACAAVVIPQGPPGPAADPSSGPRQVYVQQTQPAFTEPMPAMWWETTATGALKTLWIYTP